jgi:glyoxylase-like metal-dependent hydrolase (beta-lactamase superfamily II)
MRGCVTVVREACESLGIPVVGIRERELDERANATFAEAAARLRQDIARLGKTVASPWDFWTSAPDLSRTGLDDHIKELLIASAQKNLPPLREHIDLFDGEKEVALGVIAIPAPGHTPGHLAIAISWGNKQLLHIVDAVLHPIHLEHPSWRNVFDLSEEEAVKTRRKLLDCGGGKCGRACLSFSIPRSRSYRC